MIQVLSYPHSFQEYSFFPLSSSLQSGKSETSFFMKLLKLVKAAFVWLQSAFMQLGKAFQRVAHYFYPLEEQKELDWEEIKEIFDTMRIAVFPIDKKEEPTTLQKKFQEAYQSLPQAARQRFDRHLLQTLALSQKPPIKEEMEQKLWIETYRKTINIEQDYIKNIRDNRIVQKAVQSFWEEIQSFAPDQDS